MHRKHILIVLFLLFIVFDLHSQIDSLPNRVAFQPFYFTMKGLRISYDRQIKSHHWIEISPLMYLADESENDDFYSLRGIGSMLYYKYYVSQNTPNSGTFIGCGAMFNYFWMEYPLYTNLIDPNTSLSISQEYRKTDFGKFGGDIIVGYDYMFASGKLIVGVYAGLGYRYVNTRNLIILDRFNKFYWDYAYSGNIMLLGFRLGFTF